ncbi:hypothetical protein A6A03_07570 [Chloroflexus islandicus]|uniref:DUF58 domain-containing protein n=1 Tax=Chloroflexus islandicus TaxID=1707952 RepID=A0A178MKU4_9CHLR|nr:DUF58 domain-containing protein [Chloroflexus islandicus]OAN48624.1 hypothetical protein A6A03_07570 [Chloroflexus islandicus]
MWFATIFRRKLAATEPPLFDEAFLRRLERLSLQAQRTLRGTPIVGQHPSRQQMPATIFNDHRPYVHGDDPRYLDWHAYARQEHLLVRLGEIEQEVAVSVLVDTSRSMVTGEPARLRLAIQLAGAIGYLALAHGDQVTVVAGAPATPVFGPARGKALAVGLFRSLRALAPGHQTDLAQAAQQVAQRRPQGGLALVISDLLTPMPIETIAQYLPAPRWQVMALHLLSPAEVAPNLHGPLELVDSETGERLALDLDDETLASYRAAAQAWRAALAQRCAASGIAYAPVMVDWPLERQIIPFLRMRRFLG